MSGTAKGRLLSKGNLTAAPSSSSSSENLTKQTHRDPNIPTSRRTHRNSYSITFDQPTGMPTEAVDTTLVHNSDAVHPTSHRNQLNLSDLLETNSLPPSNKNVHKDLLIQASS